MESIRNWLNSSRNYNIGVALYEAHGDDEALKKALLQGESQYRADRLLKALRGIYEQAKQDAPEISTAAVTLPLQPAKTIASTPDHSKDPYYEQWSPLYKEMHHLRSQLSLFTTDKERGAAAFRILELERTVKHFWDRRDYFLQYNCHMPDDSNEPEAMTDRNKLHKRLMNLRTYVTRLTKTVKKEPYNTEAANRLDMYKREKDELEQKLKQDATD